MIGLVVANEHPTVQIDNLLRKGENCGLRVTIL